MQFLQFGDDSHEEAEVNRRFSEIQLRRKPCRFMAHLNQQLPPPDEDASSAALSPTPLLKTLSSNGPILRQSSPEADPEQALPKKANGRKRITIEKKVSPHLLLDGAGVIKLKDGKVVFGTWKEGTMVGEAKIMYPSGSLYIGEVKDYVRNGKGLFSYPNGYKYEGDFMNGKFHGYGVLTNEQGEIVSKGVWGNGALVQSVI